MLIIVKNNICLHILNIRIIHYFHIWITYVYVMFQYMIMLKLCLKMVLSNTLTIVVNVLLNNASGFLICKLKFGLFILSGVLILIITVIICLLILETTDVPSNEMIERVWVWKKHPFWRICFSSECRTIVV